MSLPPLSPEMSALVDAHSDRQVAARKVWARMCAAVMPIGDAHAEDREATSKQHDELHDAACDLRNLLVTS